MGFFTALVVALVMAVVGELLRPKQKPPNAKAAALDDFDIPTAEEGRSIPAFCGKVKIDGANVVWYGDLEVIAIKKKVKTGWFSSTKQTIGHRYLMGMMMALAHGFGRTDVQCHEILFGDKMPKHTRTDEPHGVVRFEFDDPDFFGGNEKEGGIEGLLRFYPGSATQEGNVYFGEQIEEEAPPYNNLVYAMAEKLYWGTSQYIKTVSFIVSSYPNQLGVPDDHHIIGEDANPACQIYELLTSKAWAIGVEPSDIDVVAFRAEAERWYTEGYGISMIYNGGSSAKDLISEILRHVDAVMFSDPKTGLITLRSARFDYDLDSIPVYGPDDFMEGITFSRPSWSETKNTIKASYVDREKAYTDSIVSMQDLSNIMQRDGEIVTEQLDFRGFTSYDACALATARSLKTMAYPLAKVTGPLPRTAWATRPGDVFKLRWPKRGINDVVFRVIRVDYGSITQNLIGIEAVEDVFAISNIAYSQPNPSDWSDPIGDALPLLRQRIVEAPMFFGGPEGAHVMTLGSRASGIDLGYKVHTGPSSGNLEYSNQTDDFTSSGTLVSDYSRSGPAVDASGFSVTGLLGPDEIEDDVDADDVRTGGTLVLVGDEIMAFGAINKVTGAVTQVLRGVLDTTPQEHAAGETVWFLDSGTHVANDQAITVGLPKAMYAKLLPYNVKGVVDEDDAPEMSVTMKSRYAAPMPPGKIRIDGGDPEAGTPGSPLTGAFSLSWAHRTRLDFEIISQDADSRTPEENATYTIRFVRVDTEALLVEMANISNTASTAAVDLNHTGWVRMEIFMVLNGIESYQRQVRTFYHSGGAANTITPDVAEYVLDGGEIT